MSATEKQVFAKLLDPSYNPKAALNARGKSAGKPKKPESRDRSVKGERIISDRDLQARHAKFLQARKQASAAPQALAKELHADEGLQSAFFEDTEELRSRRAKALARVKERFSRALTDKELWDILEEKAFDGITKHFSQPSPTEKNKTKSKVDITREMDAAVLAHNYPHILVAFVDELRDHFPSSHMAFTVLEAVKTLGRQSYILGASTPLYNGVILATWRIRSDFPRINELLLEMENAALEFDFDTQDILHKIRRQGERILKGERGELVKKVWELDSMMSGWTTVVEWIPKVRERLEAEALRKASETEEAEESAMEDEWNDAIAQKEEQEEALRVAAAGL